MGILSMVLVVGSSAFIVVRRTTNNDRVDKIFGTQLDAAIADISSLKKFTQQKKGKKKLINAFQRARLSYKKVSVLINYFHPSETKLLNGAALERTEEDNPETVYAPHGFQVIEASIYEWNDSSLIVIAEESERIEKIYQQLKRQPDRGYKFKDAEVLAALQNGLIRVMTIGIAGFDSPIANYSVPETGATLQSIDELIQIYLPSHELHLKFLNAGNYLHSNIGFNKFDRLVFLTEHMQSIYAEVAALQSENIPNSQPVNRRSASLFSEDTFNEEFFASGRFPSTPERIALGKKLFFEPLLSSTKNRSCATCHKPELAFTDGSKKALSIDQKTYLQRNTPTLWNSVFQTRQFFDSRANLLEHQLNAVVHSQQEMGGSLAQSVKDLAAHKEYTALFEKAYSKEEEKISHHTIANAISTYVRSLSSFNSRFDQYMRGDKSKLKNEEKKGFNLFMGKAKCGTCHFLPLFNGLTPPEYSDTESEVIGVPATTDKKKAMLDKDEGKFVHSRSRLHKYAFKTPTLRNIDPTAPYMHNGVFDTLEEVMEFYNNGGGTGLNIAPENQTLDGKKLNLSKKEIKQVILFMKSLTDSSVFQYR